jgi:hypothetical protein
LFCFESGVFLEVEFSSKKEGREERERERQKGEENPRRIKSAPIIHFSPSCRFLKAEYALRAVSSADWMACFGQRVWGASAEGAECEF